MRLSTPLKLTIRKRPKPGPFQWPITVALAHQNVKPLPKVLCTASKRAAHKVLACVREYKSSNRLHKMQMQDIAERQPVIEAWQKMAAFWILTRAELAPVALGIGLLSVVLRLPCSFTVFSSNARHRACASCLFSSNSRCRTSPSEKLLQRMGLYSLQAYLLSVLCIFRGIESLACLTPRW